MTSNDGYAPSLTTGPTTPLEIRAIYDSNGYRVEIRECGRMVKATSGNFLGSELNNTNDKISKLTEIVSDSLKHVVALGSGNLEDYTIHSSIQPVLNVNSPNVVVETKYEPTLDRMQKD
jgi:hypothetical protein